MNRYYKERFQALRRISKRLAAKMEVNEVLEILRDEIKRLVPATMEACILLLDPEALKYTRPLQCALYNRPINCQTCKRNRKAVQKALAKKKNVVVSASEPIFREDGTSVTIGPEGAIPVFVGGEILAVVNVVVRPGSRFTKREFYFVRDIAETVGNVIINAKRHWEMTQEKIKISQMLTHLSPFVPQTVRSLAEKDPDKLNLEKQERDVTVLFLDLEGYTRLTGNRSEQEVNDLVERIFSSFVDPIHRSGGDINETAGDGLMIIFKEDEPAGNAINAVKTAFDIFEINGTLNKAIGSAFGPININIGINSGKALLGPTRLKGLLNTRMTYTATGQVTNLAARLADHARGGDILIGEETEKLIRGIWPVYERDAATLKGMDSPSKVYSLMFPV